MASEECTNPVRVVAALITIINLAYFIISFVNMQKHQDSENECVVDLRNYLITCPILHCFILFIAMMYMEHPRACCNEDGFAFSCFWTFWGALPIFIWSCKQLYATDEVCVDTLKTDYSMIWTTFNLEVYTWLGSVALFAASCACKYYIDRRTEAHNEKLRREYEAGLQQPVVKVEVQTGGQTNYGSTDSRITPLLTAAE